MNYLNSVKYLISPAMATLCAVAIILLQLPKANLQNRQTDKAEFIRQEASEKLRLSLLKHTPSFGFTNLIGDWAYLNSIQYFGDGVARKQTGYSLCPEYFEIIVDRNPKLVSAYFTIAPATSLFAGRPDRSVALIEQGLQSISPTTAPKAYLLWFYKGVDEMLFLGDYKAARHSYEMAAQWASIFPDESSQTVATRAREIVRFLAKNPNSVQARIGAWATILSNSQDEATLKLVVNNIRKLGGEIIINSDGSLQIKSPIDK